MQVDIWSDIVCPFCYIGTTQFNRALADFDHRKEVKVTHHSFQLDPTISRDDNGSSHETLANKLGIPIEEAKQMNERVTHMAASVGLEYNMDQTISTNSFDAHRLVHFAAAHGKQEAMLIRLFKAHFTEGKHIGDHTTLAELASDVGLDKKEINTMLKSDKYANDVNKDIETARHIGISGVPFFIFNNKYGVSGAQGEEVFADVLQKAWNEEYQLQK